MQLLPEVEVWYGLPALRAALAKALKTRGKTQKQIAHTLGITESAVSQYLTGKRGMSRLPLRIVKEIDVSADRMLNASSGVVVSELMRLVHLLRETRVICDLHRQHVEGLPAKCEHCFP